MASMSFDDDGLLEEPCLSCDKAYVEDIWHEWCCDEKECPYEAESEEAQSKQTDGSCLDFDFDKVKEILIKDDIDDLIVDHSQISEVLEQIKGEEDGK